MINNDMNDEKEDKKPDDTGSVLVSEHIKIFDPETEQVYVNIRGEN